MSFFTNKYLMRALSTSEGSESTVLEQYFIAHQNGELELAAALMAKIAPEQIPEPEMRELFDADKNLLLAKAGLKPDTDLVIKTSTLAFLINQYGLFTHFFWVDHRLCVKCIHRMFWRSIRCGRLDFLAMTIFLFAHLRTIANKKICSFWLAGCIYRVTLFLRKKKILMSPFTHDIIIATFPYTNFVRADFKGMTAALYSSVEHLPADPYYILLYQITFLYSAAYRGNIVDTEKTVSLFRNLQQKGKLIRYVPVTTLMSQLPYCIRGYEHLVKQDFLNFIDQYDPESHDVLINSQVYRIAAIIFTSLNDYDRAHLAIESAVAYRKRAFFESWTHIDEKIRQVINRRMEIEEIFELFSDNQSDSSAHLKSGYLMGKLVEELGQVDGDINSFALNAASIISQHLDASFHRASDQLHPAANDELQLNIFSESFMYRIADPHKYARAKHIVELLIPSLRSMESTVLRLKSAQEKVKRQEKLAAIAGTTQMLAHDVRQPFRLMQGILDEIRNATPEEGKIIADKFLPEVERAIYSVNGMLTDIMEFGNESAIKSSADCSGKFQDLTDPTEMIKSVVSNVTSLYRAPALKFIYDFKHRSLLLGQEYKLSRIFTNLIENAVQAIGDNPGEITVSSEEREQMIFFRVHNSGSFINAQETEHIFDLFYTQGKKSGTGLGLAIVKKIIESHGGTIRCNSNPETGTEFSFGLHIDKENYSDTMTSRPTIAREKGCKTPPADSNVIVVDDCSFIRHQWEGLPSAGKIQTFIRPEDFLGQLVLNRDIIDTADAIVTDFHFDNSSEYNGLSFAAAIRGLGYTGSIFLSTEAELTEDGIARYNVKVIAKDPAIAFAQIRA